MATQYNYFSQGRKSYRRFGLKEQTTRTRLNFDVQRGGKSRGTRGRQKI